MELKDINDPMRWDAFCGRLAKMTLDGGAQWDSDVQSLRREDALSKLYVTDYKTWHILVYECRYKYWQSESEFEWQDDIRIELIDSFGRSVWVLPKVANRHRLFDAIQFQDSRAESLLNDFLAKDDE